MKLTCKLLEKGYAYSVTNGTIYKFSNHEIKSRTKATGPIILLKSFCSVNSAGGFTTSFDFYNNSSKTIKYLTINVSVLNRVNDVVSCDIWRKSSFNLKYTGPLTAHSFDNPGWSAYMYNYSADHVRINSMTITYMDGTTKTLSRGDFIDIRW